jgi:uncharacterized membrane protein
MVLLKFAVALTIFATLVDICNMVVNDYRYEGEWTKMSDVSLGVAVMAVFLELYFVLGA